MNEQDPHQFFSLEERLTNRPVGDCSPPVGGLKYCRNALRRILLVANQRVVKPLHKSKDLTLALILAVALIDALLLAIVRIRLIQSQGYDLGRSHPAAVRPAPR